MINTTKLRGNFTALPNEMLRSKSLSLTAKGLLSMMLSHSGTWVMSLEDIEEYGFEGRERIRGAVKELEQAGFVSRSHPKDPVTKTFKGTVWTWSNYPIPIGERTRSKMDQEPTDGKPTVGKPTTGKPTVGNPSVIKKINLEEDYREESTVSKDKTREYPSLDSLGWDDIEAAIGGRS